MRGVFDVTPHVRIGQENILRCAFIKTKTPGVVTTQGLAEGPGPNGGLLGADNPTLHAAVAGTGCRPSAGAVSAVRRCLPALWRRCPHDRSMDSDRPKHIRS
jgi:hypothetical protein